MMGKTILVFIFAVILVTEAQFSSKSGHCPLKDTIRKCMPRCSSDFQCSFSEKCCPNSCGSSSCASATVINTGNGNNGGNHGDRTVWCNGRQCGAYEKCEFDRRTKQEKCVRT